MNPQGRLQRQRDREILKNTLVYHLRDTAAAHWQSTRLPSALDILRPVAETYASGPHVTRCLHVEILYKTIRCLTRWTLILPLDLNHRTA